MPIGSGTELLSTLPGQPYVADKELWRSLTRPNVAPFDTARTFALGSTVRVQVPQVGILAAVNVTFQGSMVVASGGTTAGRRYYHGLLSKALLSINGQEKEIVATGEDLHVRRFAAWPAYVEDTDVFPGTLGGGAISAGTYDLEVGWRIPVPMDPTTMTGGVYAQSTATNIALEVTPVTAYSELFSANDDKVTITGTWTFEHVFFAIPKDSAGQLVIPQLDRIHTMVATDTPINNAGEVRVPLVPTAGQLCRLFISGTSSATAQLSALYSASASSRIDALRLEYGGNERPFVFNPATSLLRRNNEHYGRRLPYGRLCIDLVREDPIRDQLLLQGVTNLNVILGLNSSVSPSTGAMAHIVQETLH